MIYVTANHITPAMTEVTYHMTFHDGIMKL